MLDLVFDGGLGEVFLEKLRSVAQEVLLDSEGLLVGTDEYDDENRVRFAVVFISIVLKSLT